MGPPIVRQLDAGLEPSGGGPAAEREPFGLGIQFDWVAFLFWQET